MPWLRNTSCRLGLQLAASLRYGDASFQQKRSDLID
jgi:hypothetical protein